MDKRLLDRNYRLSHLYKIKDKQGQLVTFKMNRAQKHFDENRHTRNIILKSRQLGFTSYETITMLDDTLFNKNFDSLLIAQDIDTAKDIFSKKVDVAWRNFPLQELYKMDNNSARQMKFDFGDKTVSSITVDNSGRGGTFLRVHISEFAKVAKMYPDKAKDILEGTIPAVPLHARIDIESTAEGEDGAFHDMFWAAWHRGDPKYSSEWRAHFYNWTWDDAEISLITEPEKNLPLAFKEYQQRHDLTDVQITYYYMKWLSLNENWTALRTSYPTTPEEAFTYSGNKMFAPERIADMKKVASDVKKKERGAWTYYDEYKTGHRYGCGVDVAEGVGQDSSTIVIWDFTPIRPKVVATFRSNTIAPDLLAFEVKNGCEKYGMAHVAVEKNNHGHATLAKLAELYPVKNIYKDDRQRLGFLTTLATKPKILFDLNTAVNDDLVDIPSLDILNEMQLYDKEDMRSNRFNPEATQHFDLLMACAIGFFMREQMKTGPSKAGQYKPTFLNRITRR